MFLPEKYIQEITALFQEETADYLRVLEKKSIHGFRINTGKITPQEFRSLFPFPLRKVPWCDCGFYDDEAIRLSTHPYHHAGLYYLQEPSAMAPAALLPVQEGDIVLDACAAPGGKSLYLANKLKGSGLLVSNDISASRQNASLKNIERFGIANAYVTCCDIREFSTKTDLLFDKILVDAPCSGEGMFRKDPSLIRAWEKKDSSAYVPIQKDIVKNALALLKPGGFLLYSTCTFSISENEEIVQYMLDLSPSLEVISLHESFPYFKKGVLPGLEGTARLYPHKLEGEGHFAALLRKKEDGTQYRVKNTVLKPFSCASLESFLALLNTDIDPSRVIRIKDQVLLQPEIHPDLSGIRTLRSGLLLGTLKKDRFEPSQHLAQFLSKDAFQNVVDLSADDIRAEKYLRGETITYPEGNDGWALVTADHFSLGFGILRSGILKNKIDRAWRKL